MIYRALLDPLLPGTGPLPPPPPTPVTNTTAILLNITGASKDGSQGSAPVMRGHFVRSQRCKFSNWVPERRMTCLLSRRNEWLGQQENPDAQAQSFFIVHGTSLTLSCYCGENVLSDSYTSFILSNAQILPITM